MTMNKMRCDRCKWWTPPQKQEWENSWGRCVLTISRRGEPERPGTRAVAQDYEGYHASLFAKADFGCVQWEQKAE